MSPDEVCITSSFCVSTETCANKSGNPNPKIIFASHYRQISLVKPFVSVIKTLNKTYVLWGIPKIKGEVKYIIQETLIKDLTRIIVVQKFF